MAEMAYASNLRGGTDIKVGVPTISIASGVATFSVDQSSNNMGRGYRVTFNTSTQVWLWQKNSGTEWVVKTVTGGVPSDVGSPVTVDSIVPEYSSLAAMCSGFTDASHLNYTDMVSNTMIPYLCPYYDEDAGTVDTSTATINFSGTTSSTYRPIVYVPKGGVESNNRQRHSGVFDTSKYYMSLTNANGLVNGESNFDVEGLQIRMSVNTGYNSGILMTPGSAIAAGHHAIRKCILDGQGTRTQLIVWGTCASGSTSLIQNTICYGSGTTTYGSSAHIYHVNDVDWTVNMWCCLGRRGANNILYEQAGTINVYNSSFFDSNSTDWNSVSGTTNYNGGVDETNGTNPVTASGSDEVNEMTDPDNDDYSLLVTGNWFIGSAVNNNDDSNCPVDDIADNPRLTGASEGTSIGPWANGEVSAGGITGTGVFTMPSVVLSGAGSLGRKGTGAFTMPSVVLSASGNLGRKGTGTIVLAAIQMAAVGNLGRKGSGAIVLAPVQLSASGYRTHQGSGAFLLPSVSLSGAGEVSGAISGTSDMVMPAIQLAAVGNLGRVGSGAINLPSLLLSASGQVTRQGSGAIVLAALQMNATGQINRQGTGSLVLAAIQLAGSGTVDSPSINGSGAIVLGAVQISASGQVTRIGAGAISLPAVQMAATGVRSHQGTGNLVLGAVTLYGVGPSAITGSGALVTPALTVSGYGTVTRASFPCDCDAIFDAVTTIGEQLTAFIEAYDPKKINELLNLVKKIYSDQRLYEAKNEKKFKELAEKMLIINKGRYGNRL